MTGTIIKGIGGFYYVEADGSVYECKARGIFRKEHITPAIGDRVEISVKNGKGAIEKILPRSSYLKRPAAANIDTLMLVVAAASPDPNLFLIDKMLINAETNGINSVICINKTDIASGEPIEKIYSSAGYPVVSVSAERDGCAEALSPYLAGHTTAFAGLSGVGKSTILSRITGGELETGSVSEKIRRGRHTTRHVELFTLREGGYVLDTPGFSSLEITEVSDIEADELWEYFPEIAAAKGCRFRGCRHINEPECAVKRLVAEGRIMPSRYDSYRAIYDILLKEKNWKRGR